MDASYQSDPKLVAACVAGEVAAWETLIDRYGRLVFSIPHRYGMSAEESEDVFQNVFAILLEKLHQLEDQTRLSAWLITTTHRECWRLGKRKPLNVELDDREVMPGSPPESLMEQWERQHLVRVALEMLGDPCQSLLTALFFQPGELNYEQLAEQLDMKVGSIGPTRGRCFQKLEVILREMGVEPDFASEETDDGRET